MCFRPWARQHHRGIKAHANDQDPDQDHNDTTSVEAGSTTSGDIVHSGEMFVVHDGGTASSTTILSGGLEIVRRDGTDSGAQISGMQRDDGLWRDGFRRRRSGGGAPWDGKRHHRVERGDA